MTALTAGSRHAPNVGHDTQGVRRDQLATAAVGLGSALLGTVIVLFGLGTIAALWAGLVILAVTPGCAVVCWHGTRSRLTRLLAVLATSMTWTVLVTTTLAWSQVTSRGILITLTAGLGGVGSAVFLGTRATARGGEHQNVPGRMEASETNPRLRPANAPPLPSSVKACLVVALIAAVALWTSALIKADGHAVGSYGLLPLLGIPFFAAVALTIGSLVLALWFVRSAWPAAGLALGLLVAEFFGTQRLLAVTPLYAYVYKHIGVVDYVFHGGALNDPSDVYQQWPGFFTAAAALVRLSGRSPLAYANWDGLLFEALNAVTLFAIARRFSNRRLVIPYIAVLLYITADWEGQEYYSPQTLAFGLSLLFQLFLLPLLEPERLRRLFRYRGWLSVPPLEMRMDIWGGERVSVTGRAVRVVGITALFGAIMITHQLSPYILFGGVAALFVLGILRHRLLILVLVIMIVAYPLLHLTVIEKNPVLDILDFSNAVGQQGFAQASPPQVLGSELAKVVTLGLWGGTAISCLSYRRRIGNIAIPLIWAAIPLSLVLVSNYGGEGIYRAFLFSSPWCALIIAVRLADLVRAPMLRLAAVGLWGIFAALASAQAQDFGQYPMSQMPLSEIQASEYFLNHAPANSTLVEAVGNFPSRLNARYVLHNTPQLANEPALDGLPEFQGYKLERMDPSVLASSVTNIAEGPAYLVIAPSMYPDLAYYGTFAPGTLPTLVQRLKVSDYWKLWYQDDGTVIFQALPQGRPAGEKEPGKGRA
jgi:hypothetical protein